MTSRLKTMSKEEKQVKEVQPSLCTYRCFWVGSELVLRDSELRDSASRKSLEKGAMIKDTQMFSLQPKSDMRHLNSSLNAVPNLQYDLD